MKSLVLIATVILIASAFADAPPNLTGPEVKLAGGKTAEQVQPIFANTVFPEIHLNNGETLRDAKFLGAGSRGANFVVERAIRSIPFSLLPSDLAKSALLFAEQTRNAEEVRLAGHSDTQEQIRVVHAAAVSKVQERAAQSVQDTKEEELAAEATARHTEQVRTDAEQSAHDYFKHHWKPGNDSVLVTSIHVMIEEVEPRAGWDGEWDVKGEAFLQYYVSSGSSFSSTNQKFSAVLKEKGSYPRFVPTLF